MAQNPHFQFDHNNQEKWMATVKNYLIGERWEMVDLLDWAERFEKTPIEEHHLKAVASSDLMQDSGFDTIQASQELWAFLNLNLVGSARAKFDKAPRLNGFDVWRRVVCPMAPKSVARRVDLHTDLHNPARAKRLADLIETVEAWEKLRDRYYEMGGQEVQSDEQCVILLKMLPSDTPASMIMVLEDFTNYEALKAKLEKQVDWLLDHPVSGNPRVQLVDGQQGQVEEQQPLEEEPADDDVVDLTALEPESQAHTLAVMRQNGFRGRVRTSTGPASRSSSAPARPVTPPRT